MLKLDQDTRCFMLKEERYDKILEILEKDTYISAQKLSQMLYVSLPTIRRDLAELHNRELIIRSYGGAKKLNSEHNVTPIDFRKTVNYNKKRQLCQAAANLIKENDLIFLDASTTVLQMADFIPQKSSIIVVTNSILLSTLLPQKGIKTFCTGGELQQNSMCYAGSFADDFAGRFNFDKVFFSSHGVNAEQVIVDTSLPESMLRKVVLNRSRESVFLCDSSKFFQSASYNLTSLENVDYIITDGFNVENNLDLNFAHKIIYV